MNRLAEKSSLPSGSNLSDCPDLPVKVGCTSELWMIFFQVPMLKESSSNLW